jgi:hypothetical protein
MSVVICLTPTAKIALEVLLDDQNNTDNLFVHVCQLLQWFLSSTLVLSDLLTPHPGGSTEEESSSILGTLTFLWVNPLFMLGGRLKDISIEEFPRQPSFMTVSPWVTKFKHHLEERVSRGKPFNLVKILLTTFVNAIVIGIILSLANDFFFFSQTILLRFFTQ